MVLGIQLKMLLMGKQMHDTLKENFFYMSYEFIHYFFLVIYQMN